MKDLWDKIKIITEIFIAIAGLLCTIIFGWKEWENKRFNEKISVIETGNMLIPYLTDKDPKKRSFAVHLANVLKNEEFAVEITNILSEIESDPDVEKSVKSSLKNLRENSKLEKVKQQAQDGLDRYSIIDELRLNGLLDKLNDAQNYVAMGGMSNEEKALAIYKEVISKLSENAMNKIDKKLLISAQNEEKLGSKDLAARKYSALFSDYITGIQK